MMRIKWETNLPRGQDKWDSPQWRGKDPPTIRGVRPSDGRRLPDRRVTWAMRGTMQMASPTQSERRGCDLL